MRPSNPITPEQFDAVLFDLDGVFTATANVHAACWKKMFDAFLLQRAADQNAPFRPFAIEADYKLYVDGKPCEDGVRSFLESRGIDLPYGHPNSPPSSHTICGLGNRKNELIHEVLASDGIEVFAGSLAFVRQLRQAGLKLAVVSSSRNCRAILVAAKIEELFELRIDGEVAAQRHLAGKPAPDTFLEAAKELGVDPKRAVVVEDAISGVQAGRAGGSLGW